MLSSLVPGFKGAGHPDKVKCREERRRAREVRRRRDEEYMADAEGDPWRGIEEYPSGMEVKDAGPGDVPDAAGEGDPRIRRPYTPEEMA